MAQRTFTAEFKFKVALELIKQEKSFSEICAQYEVHPTQATLWRKQLLEAGSTVFATQRSNPLKEKDELIEALYKKIGQREIELDWLKKKMESVS